MMTIDDDSPRIGPGRPGGPAAPGPLTKLLGVVVGAVVVVASLLFSVVFFAIVVSVGAIAGAYLWWRTRELRRQVRAHMEAQMQAQRDAAARGQQSRPGGWRPEGPRGQEHEDVVIEGDYIRETPDDRAASPRDDGNPPR
jgi:hypothetical protein